MNHMDKMKLCWNKQFQTLAWWIFFNELYKHKTPSVDISDVVAGRVFSRRKMLNLYVWRTDAVSLFCLETECNRWKHSRQVFFFMRSLMIWTCRCGFRREYPPHITPKMFLLEWSRKEKLEQPVYETVRNSRVTHIRVLLRPAVWQTDLRAADVCGRQQFVCVLCFQVQRSQDRVFQSIVTVAQKRYRSSLWSVHTRTHTHTPDRSSVKSSRRFQGEVEEVCRTSGRHRLSASPGRPGGSNRRGRLRPGLQEEEGREDERHHGGGGEH